MARRKYLIDEKRAAKFVKEGRGRVKALVTSPG
jgi:hypothetical protein